MNIEPVNSPLALIDLFDGSVEDLDGASGDAGRRADISTNAVAANEASNRILRNLPAAVGIDGDARALFGGMNLVQMKVSHD